MDSPKYDRTFHLPWSEGCSNDDKKSISVEKLIGVDIIITEKCDGSNASLEAEGIFARTHAHIPTHPSFDWLKSFYSTVKYKIPQGIQLFGENMFAKHSIQYEELPGYFLLFNVRDLNYQEDIWLSWQEVEEWAREIGVPTVPILFKGQVSFEKELQELTKSFMMQPSLCGGIKEGVVVRIADSFKGKDFSECIQKMVRKDHIQTSEHWKTQVIIKNKLKLPNTDS